MSISLCMIVKNEEQFIERVLTDAKKYVDQMVVIDTGSTDKTKEIAKRCEAEVHDFEWCDDFSKARNESLEYATSDWILSLDADETLDVKDYQKLVNLAGSSPLNYAYVLRVRFYSTGERAANTTECTGEYPEFEADYPRYSESTNIKFFPRRADIFYDGVIHEIIDTSLAAIAKEEEFHLSNSNIIVQQLRTFQESKKLLDEKYELYESYLRKKVEQSLEDWKAHYEMGVFYVNAKNWQETIELGLAFLSKSIDLHKHYINLLNRGYAYMKLHEYSKAANDFEGALQLRPNDQVAMRGLIAASQTIKLDSNKQTYIPIESVLKERN
jgi:glycosyltransferase involved in cell wall biosynthesis